MCARIGWEGQAQCATTNSNEATERTQASTEQAARTNVSGQCEVLAKCERTLELSCALYTGAPRADGKSEKAEFGKCNDLTELLETEPAAQTKNFLPSPFRLAAGGLGGAAKK